VVACRCVQNEDSKERQSRLEHYSGLGALRRLDFENLIPQGHSGHIADQEMFSKAHKAAKAFAAAPKGWLILCGPSGSGKTHLAVAIAGDRLKNGLPALYRVTADLLDELRSTFVPEADLPYSQSFEQVRNAPLLVLDDLGTQSSTPWAIEKLDQLLTYRAGQELPTVITLSVPLEQFDDRMRNRLTDPALARLYHLKDKQSSSLDKTWGLGLELQKSMTFDKFDWRRVNLTAEQRQNLEQTFRLALEYAKSPEGWLVLQGATGTGKTHLAAAIVNHRYQAGQPALFVVVPEFLDHLRSTFSPESKVSYDQLFERVKTTPLLVFDDFGEQASTPWAQEKLYQVINYRYNAQLPTVVTTRRTLDEIDDPVGSRFIDPKMSVAFNINVPDYRGDKPPGRATQGSRRRKGRA
jgi:DNA replication protein DnaC